jgi:hypothetical protein
MHCKHFDVNNSLFDIPTSIKEANDIMLTSKIFLFWYIVMLEEEVVQLLKWWKAHLVMFLHVSFVNKHILTSLNVKLKLNEYFRNYDFSYELETMSPQNYKTRCACIEFQKLVK